MTDIEDAEPLPKEPPPPEDGGGPDVANDPVDEPIDPEAVPA